MKSGAGLIILGVITIIIGIVCYPIVSDTVADALDGNNSSDASDDVTGSEATILNAIPLFYLLGVLIGGIALMILPILDEYKSS